MESEDHEHCESCFKLYCNAVGVCKMVQCEFGCRLRMHKCKVNDHQSVCPKMRVPCSNVAYGCPATLQREKIKIHLAVCPASAIFCTMEWNRYPVYSKSRLNWVPFFQPNPVPVKGQLDVELALRDQRILGDVFKKRCRKGKSKVDVIRVHNKRLSSSLSSPHENGFESRTPIKHSETQTEMALALSKLENKLRFRKYENNGCAGDNNGDSENFELKLKVEKHEVVHATSTCEIQQGIQSESEIFEPQDWRCRESALSSVEDKENTGPPLTQLEAQRKPFEVSFLHNAPLGNTENACGDPSDHEKSVSVLSASETDKEKCFHKIAVEVSDSDLSTYDENIDFNTNATLPPPPEFVPIHLAEPLGLNVMLETLPKFQKQIPLYSIPCNQVFRRDEYGAHFRNVHSEIHGGLNGWLEQRCPLAQYGCTYVRYRLHPHTQCGQVVFNQDLGNFGVRPCMDRNNRRKQCNKVRSSSGNQGKREGCPHQVSNHTTSNLLCQLPMEILEVITGLLDGFSLCNFSCTCKLLREVCRRLLIKKGIVLFEWEKRIYDTGEWSWQVRKRKWFFSTSFTPVNTWVHTDAPSMSAHMETCRYYERNVAHRQFRYHSTKLPPHMDSFDTTWSGSDLEDNVLPSHMIRRTRKSDFFEERIQELEDIAAGRRVAYAQPMGDYNLEFVIQCNENCDEPLGEHDFAVAEAASPDAPKLAVQYNASQYEGDANTSDATAPQGACANAATRSSDAQKFDPCQTAAEIARAYMYMYSGVPTPGTSDDADEPCGRGDDDDDDGLPLVYVPSSYDHSKEKTAAWSTSDQETDINAASMDDHFLCASEPMLQTIGRDVRHHRVHKSASAPDIAFQIADDSNPNLNAHQSAEAVANAYMYLYTGSHHNPTAAILHDKETAERLATHEQLDTADPENIASQGEGSQSCSGDETGHDQAAAEQPENDGEEPTVMATEKSSDKHHLESNVARDCSKKAAHNKEGTGDTIPSDLPEEPNNKQPLATDDVTWLLPGNQRDAAEVAVAHDQEKDTAERITGADDVATDNVATDDAVVTDDASYGDERASFSCSAESDASSEETSESSASMHFAPGGEGPLYVSVEDVVEHDEMEGSILGSDGGRVAYEIHVEVEHE